MKDALPPSKSPQLSVVSNVNAPTPRLTRAQVAERIGASTSTVRRYEGTRLHPRVDEDGAHWFDPKEVTALAASRANEAIARGRIRNNSGSKPTADARTRGEIAALVFERFEQRQSHAEIVIGLRIEPEVVRELFDQWCLGLTEGQLRRRDPRVPREREIETVGAEGLARRLASLPEGEVTRISVGRWRGVYQGGEENADYAWIVELGGFHVSGPCSPAEITRRFGSGSYRVTACVFDPPSLRWEVMVEELSSSQQIVVAQPTM